MDALIYASVVAVVKNSIFKFRLQSYVKKLIFANFRGRYLQIYVNLVERAQKKAIGTRLMAR